MGVLFVYVNLIKVDGAEVNLAYGAVVFNNLQEISKKCIFHIVRELHSLRHLVLLSCEGLIEHLLVLLREDDLFKAS